MLRIAEEKDWPTHCAFFEKDTDFDITPFLNPADSTDLCSEKRNLPTYEEFIKLLSDSPEHPSVLKSDDVMIDINLDSPCHGCLDALSSPVQCVQECDQQRNIIGMRLAGKSVRFLQGEDSGDGSPQLTNGVTATHEEMVPQVISLPPTNLSITQSHNTFFGAVRKQLSNLFTRADRRPSDSEFYV